MSNEQRPEIGIATTAGESAGSSPLFAPTDLYSYVNHDLAQPRWAVEGIWPSGDSGVIGGRPKDKKSTLAVELAISLATGTPMFGLDEFKVNGRPQPVLYVQQENADSRVQRDFQLILEARGLGKLTEYEDAIGVDADDEPITATFTRFENDGVLDYFGAISLIPRFEILSNAGFDLSKSEHREWLLEHVRECGFKYVFVDPLYQLIGAVDEKDSKELRPLLQFFTQIKNELGVAVIFTHHMSDKNNARNKAASLLGSTYIHGWYEAALFTRSTQDHVVSLHVDAQRSFGVAKEHRLAGQGVGRWLVAEVAEDSLGRDAPQTTRRQVNIRRTSILIAENPDWTDDRLAAELGVARSTANGYRQAIGQSA